MKRYTLLQAALLTCGLSFSAASFAGGASGTMLAYTCAGCHGTNGISTGPAAPSIAGSDYDYLVDSMNQFKAGERRSTIMTRIAKGYTDAEIEAMSKFFADQKYVLASQQYDTAAAKRGGKLHKKYCNNCHEDAGTLQDPDEDTGMLGGQWKPYLTYTFVDYLAGEREMGKKMKKKFKKMHKKAGDKGIADLLEFYASQK
jgi:sulfide dehydrogenase cytochrome subunit